MESTYLAAKETIPKETIPSEREQITIRLPSELREQLQKWADMMGISFNSVLIIILRKGLGLE